MIHYFRLFYPLFCCKSTLTYIFSWYLFIFHANGQERTNQNLSKFGFSAKYIELPCDGHILLQSTDTNLWGRYFVSFEENQIVTDQPESILQERYDSIHYHFSHLDWSCQYFYLRKGKMGYLPSGLLPSKTNKLFFVWEDVVIPETTFEWDGQVLEYDWCYVKKNNKWGINFISSPVSIWPCEFDDLKQLPLVSVVNGQKEEIIHLQKKLKSDKVIPLLGSYESLYRGYKSFSEDLNQFYQVWHPKTKLWGIYKIENKSGKYHIHELFHPEFEEVAYEYVLGEHGTLLGKKHGTWGRYHLQQFYPMTELNYTDKESVPKVCLNPESYQFKQNLMRKWGFDQIEPDNGNGDGVALVRHAKTAKWGMIQQLNSNNIQWLIPMKYDAIDFFEFNAKLTGVWNNGKVGIYQSPWSYGEEDAKQTVDCLYEAYKIFNVEKTVYDGVGNYRKYFDYVAVKKDGLWAWIDWMTGELKTDFLYDLDKEQMPYPEFEQEN
jgi:hypothetical protein